MRWFLAGLTLLYAGLFLANSLTRTRQFSADSFTYVDVARNLIQGRGLVQSTLVIGQPMNFRPNGESSAPFIVQPPLFPLLIGLNGAVLGSYPDGALLASSLGLLAILCLSFLLGRVLYDELTGWLTIGLLSIAPQLSLISQFAWSETTGIACVLLVLYLLAVLHKRLFNYQSVNKTKTGVAINHESSSLSILLMAFCAGLAAGLAFDTRYALGALLPFCLLFLLVEQQFIRKSWLDAVVFASGWLLVAWPVLSHNLDVADRLLPGLHPSDRSWLTNLNDAFYSIFGVYFPPQELSPLQLITPLVFILMISALAYRQGRIKTYLADILIHNGRWLLIGWISVFSLTMIVQRSLSFFDPLGARLMSPASIPMLICAAALVIGLIHPRHQALAMLLIALVLVFASGRELLLLLTTPPAPSEAQVIASRPRLAWVRDHTSARDLLIGDTLGDIVFYLERPSVVSYSAYPYTERLDQATLQSLVEQNCSNFDNFYLLTSLRPGRPREHREIYGELIGSLMHENDIDDAHIILLDELPDSRIFQLNYCP